MTSPLGRRRKNDVTCEETSTSPKCRVAGPQRCCWVPTGSTMRKSLTDAACVLHPGSPATTTALASSRLSSVTT